MPDVPLYILRRLKDGRKVYAFKQSPGEYFMGDPGDHFAGRAEVASDKVASEAGFDVKRDGIHRKHNARIEEAELESTRQRDEMLAELEDDLALEESKLDVPNQEADRVEEDTDGFKTVKGELRETPRFKAKHLGSGKYAVLDKQDVPHSVAVTGLTRAAMVEFLEDDRETWRGEQESRAAAEAATG